MFQITAYYADESEPVLSVFGRGRASYLKKNLFRDKGSKVNFNKQDYVGGFVLALETFFKKEPFSHVVSDRICIMICVTMPWKIPAEISGGIIRDRLWNGIH